MKGIKFVLSPIYSDKDNSTVLKTSLNYNKRLNTFKLNYIVNNWKFQKTSSIYKFIYFNTCSNGHNNINNILKGHDA